VTYQGLGVLSVPLAVWVVVLGCRLVVLQWRLGKQKSPGGVTPGRG
jgi:hypothetical protein